MPNKVHSIKKKKVTDLFYLESYYHFRRRVVFVLVQTLEHDVIKLNIPNIVSQILNRLAYNSLFLILHLIYLN